MVFYLNKIKIIQTDLLNESDILRHNSKKLGSCIKKVIGSEQNDHQLTLLEQQDLNKKTANQDTRA